MVLLSISKITLIITRLLSVPAYSDATLKKQYTCCTKAIGDIKLYQEIKDQKPLTVKWSLSFTEKIIFTMDFPQSVSKLNTWKQEFPFYVMLFLHYHARIHATVLVKEGDLRGRLCGQGLRKPTRLYRPWVEVKLTDWPQMQWASKFTQDKNPTHQHQNLSVTEMTIKVSRDLFFVLHFRNGTSLCHVYSRILAMSTNISSNRTSLQL